MADKVWGLVSNRYCTNDERASWMDDSYTDLLREKTSRNYYCKRSV